jgi:hypothetical protein
MRPGRLLTAVTTALASWTTLGLCAEMKVGFGKADIKPDVHGDRPVWIAGYGHNRRATGVHDPLYARAVVLDDGATKVALVSVDLIGFMYPNTKAVRRQLDGFAYVLVANTHDHEGPDTIGLWGPTPRQSGVDPDYLKKAEAGVVAAARQAEAAAAPVKAEYGTAEDETLLQDARLPIVKDGVLRVVRFSRADDGKPAGLLVQWNCHPETLGSRNTLITADFPYYAISVLEKKYGGPVAYFSGAVGGLMTGPEGRIKAADGTELKEGDYAYAQGYGEAVAALAGEALKDVESITLSPIVVSARPVALPLANPGYRMGRAIGVLDREGFAWTGDPDRLGAPIPDPKAPGDLAIESEVGCVRLGDLHVAAIPGELYPELVYGHYQDPADPNADAPDAPLEPPAMKSLPGPKTLLFGLPTTRSATSSRGGSGTTSPRSPTGAKRSSTERSTASAPRRRPS